VSLGGEAGAVLLKKFGLLEQAIDYAMESGAFAHAFELTRIGGAPGATFIQPTKPVLNRLDLCH